MVSITGLKFPKNAYKICNMHISNYTAEFSNRMEGKKDKLTVSVTDGVALTCQSLYVMLCNNAVASKPPPPPLPY